MTIRITKPFQFPQSIPVVERAEDGTIIDCNHDCDSVWEDVDVDEFDADSGQFAPTGTRRIGTCEKCEAEVLEDGYGEIPKGVK